MEASLVLRAASCWHAWGIAMNILRAMRLSHDTAQTFLQQAYWGLTRVADDEYHRITSQILRDGLCGGTIRLHASDWDNGESLVMLLWKPPEGFVHLLNDVGRRERPGAIPN